MDFVVLKVNGKDVSSASHEDTIAAFTAAQEPIIVEVLKRPFRQNQMGSEPLPSVLCDISTQTDWTGAAWDPSTSSAVFQPNSAAASMHQALSTNDAINNHYSTVAGEPEVDEDDGCDVEYEEVILYRSPNEAKLGLTLCYGAPDEVDTDIYISEIEPESIAAKDGRIQEGDQLLQINGIDVRSRDHAVSLFSERRPDFALLLARPQLPVEFLLEENSADFQPYNIRMENEEDAATTDTGITENVHLEKDSGVGRTDESTKNEESSEHEVVDTFTFSREIHNSSFRNENGFPKTEDGCYNDDSMLKHEFQKIRSQISNKAVTLTPLCRFQSDASLDREMALLNKEMENIQLECESLVHRHLESQQKTNGLGNTSRCQLEHVYVNLTDLNLENSKRQGVSLNKKETVERWVNGMFLSKECTVGKQDMDSSSAYNTADSSGSGPLTLELTPVSARHDDMYGSVMSLISPRMEDKGTQLRDSDVASMFSCDSCRRCCKALVEREGSLSSVLTSANNNPVQFNNAKQLPNKGYHYVNDKEINAERFKEERNKNYVMFYPPPNTMYTNQANLQHTIWLQQQMLRQSMTQQKAPKASASGSYPPNGQIRGASINPKSAISSLNKNNFSHQISFGPSKAGALSTVKEEEEMKMEWKVKKRADGTRYITRRPVRNRLLKARALKILEERTGMTTDDDAVSEMKTGKYWNKEDRKRHLERAKDRKRKEMVFRSKMACVKEQGEDPDDVRKEINILELSHKKMMKRRGQVVFDDFTTIQEVLAHGTKVSNTGSKQLGLLTVTTV